MFYDSDAMIGLCVTSSLVKDGPALSKSQLTNYGTGCTGGSIDRLSLVLRHRTTQQIDSASLFIPS